MVVAAAAEAAVLTALAAALQRWRMRWRMRWVAGEARARRWVLVPWP